MSGHNKWSKIKYVKAKEDAKKGKVFARFAHEIMLAAHADALSLPQGIKG